MLTLGGPTLSAPTLGDGGGVVGALITIEGTCFTSQGVDGTRTLDFILRSSGDFNYQFEETEVRNR